MKHGDRVRFKGDKAHWVFSTMIVDQVQTCDETGHKYAHVFMVSNSNIGKAMIPVVSLEIVSEEEMKKMAP